MVFLALSPIVAFLFLIHMQPKLERPETKVAYGALYADLRTDSASGYGYAFIYLLRRTVYGLSIGLLSSCPGLQMNFQILVSLCVFGYVATNFPFQLTQDNLLELLNEGTVLLVMTLCVRFADAAPDPTVANIYGFYVIGVIACNIAVNMSIFIHANIKLIYLKIKNFIEKRRAAAKEVVVKMLPEETGA